jgi:glutathione-specific gamma-glutamylcyclotransferase
MTLESCVLSRELILSGAFLEAFASVPDNIRWPLEKINESLSDALAKRPANDEVWLFGYGSLIWNPLFEHDAQEIATLNGWHRSFCLRIIAGRASVESPGRMLSIEPGGSVKGVALRLPKEGLAEELQMIWIREMVTGAYSPIWEDVTLAGEKQINALVFTANPSYAHHELNSEVSNIAPLICAASGPIGTNADYVRKLHSALHEHDIPDPYVDALIDELNLIAARAST